MICNQAASFNSCLFKVQQNMQEHMKTMQSEGKGKGSAKVFPVLDEMQFLMDFNVSITQAAAKTMEHLSEFVFVSMGNLTLARRDSSLNHIKGGVKPNTIATLRTAPLHIPTLFPYSIIKGAEEEIPHFEAKGHSSSRGKGRYHPYERTEKRSDKRSDPKSDRLAWKNIGKGNYKKPKGSLPATHRDQPRASSHINDKYCVTKLQARLLAGSSPQTIDICSNLNVNPHVVITVHTAPGHSQKRELSPGSAGCYCKDYKLKSVKSVSCVTQLSCVQKMLPQICL